MQRLIHIQVLCAILTATGLGQGNRNWDFDEVLFTIGVREGMVIGEAGAGAGFFTFHLSRAVGSGGKIYANDISTYALNRLRDRIERENVSNIIRVTGEENDPRFPVNQLEMIVIVHAFHDFDQPGTWLKNTLKYVRDGAPLVIIEKDPDRWGEGRYHFMTETEILQVLKSSGFLNIEVLHFTAEDNIYLTHFKK